MVYYGLLWFNRDDNGMIMGYSLATSKQVLNMTIEIGSFPIEQNMVTFHGYVRLPEGKLNRSDALWRV